MRQRFFLKCFLLLSIILVLSNYCLGAEIIASVGVKNEPPSAFNVTVSPISEDNVTQVLWCRGMGYDRNGAQDLAYYYGEIGKSDDSGNLLGEKIEASISRYTVLSITDGLVVLGFILTPEHKSGKYLCVLQVTDLGNASASNKTIFTLMPKSCVNGGKDAGEEGVDCGAGCVPCSCINGVQDAGEDGVDCGGACKPCITGALEIRAPDEVTSGDSIIISVLSGGAGVKSLVRLTSPDGKLQAKVTDNDGKINVTLGSVGIWGINADSYGYTGASKTISVKQAMNLFLIVGVIVVVLLIVLIIVLTRKKKGKPSSGSQK